MKIFFIIPAYAGAIGHNLNGYQVEKRRRREGMGTWEYRLVPPALKQPDLI